MLKRDLMDGYNQFRLPVVMRTWGTKPQLFPSIAILLLRLLTVPCHWDR